MSSLKSVTSGVFEEPLGAALIHGIRSLALDDDTVSDHDGFEAWADACKQKVRKAMEAALERINDGVARMIRQEDAKRQRHLIP